MEGTIVKHFKIHIKGRVQGVYFRASASDMAQELGLVGFVSNQADGSVYAEVEGDMAQLEKFLDWCHKGPGSAAVEQVDYEEGDIVGFREFNIG